MVVGLCEGFSDDYIMGGGKLQDSVTLTISLAILITSTDIFKSIRVTPYVTVKVTTDKYSPLSLTLVMTQCRLS